MHLSIFFSQERKICKINCSSIHKNTAPHSSDEAKIAKINSHENKLGYNIRDFYFICHLVYEAKIAKINSHVNKLDYNIRDFYLFAIRYRKQDFGSDFFSSCTAYLPHPMLEIHRGYSSFWSEYEFYFIE